MYRNEGPDKFVLVCVIISLIICVISLALSLIRLVIL